MAILQFYRSSIAQNRKYVCRKENKCQIDKGIFALNEKKRLMAERLCAFLWSWHSINAAFLKLFLIKNIKNIHHKFVMECSEFAKNENLTINSKLFLKNSFVQFTTTTESRVCCRACRFTKCTRMGMRKESEWDGGGDKWIFKMSYNSLAIVFII